MVDLGKLGFVIRVEFGPAANERLVAVFHESFLSDRELAHFITLVDRGDACEQPFVLRHSITVGSHLGQNDLLDFG